MFAINLSVSAVAAYAIYHHHTEVPDNIFEPYLGGVSNELFELMDQDNKDMVMLEEGALPELDIPDPCAKDEFLFSATMRDNMAALEQLIAPIPHPQTARTNILANIDDSDDDTEVEENELEKLYTPNADDACSINSEYSALEQSSTSSGSSEDMESADQCDDYEPTCINAGADLFRFNSTPFLSEDPKEVYEMCRVPGWVEAENEDNDMVDADEADEEDEEDEDDIMECETDEEEEEDEEDASESEEEDVDDEDSEKDFADNQEDVEMSEEETEKNDRLYHGSKLRENYNCFATARVGNGLSKWKNTS